MTFSNYVKSLQPRAIQKMDPRSLRLDIQFFADGDDPENKGAGADPGKEFKELLLDIQKTSKDFAQRLAAVETEAKNGGVSDDTKNKFDDMEKKFTALQSDLAKFKRPGYEQGDGAEQIKSAAEIFVESDAYKTMIKNGENKSGYVEVKSLFERKALVTSDTASAGTLVTRDRQAGIIAQPDRDIWLRDLLDVQTTQSNAIEYVRETGFTNNAGIAPEGTVKPESALTFGVETANVKTIAHWIPATRQIIADAGQLQAYINGRLQYGLKLAEERQILYGDGTGDNLSGLFTDPDIQDLGGVGALNPADNELDHIRRGLTRVILAGYPATGIVMNPVNFEDIELMKADNGQYLWLNIGDQLTPRLFRIPVVQTPAVNQNEFMMGAFGLGAQLWDRETANIRIGEPNDYFIRNMVAILAEERLALTKFRPEAFVSGSFTPVTGA